MKIYTKTGDKGCTSLIGGTRVPKHHLRIESYGTVDELNAFTGLLRDEVENPHAKEALKKIQDCLFTIGSNLASDPGKSKMKVPDINDSDITYLEDQIDKMNETLPELKHFILPGGNRAISYSHLARCVCRRAERIVVHLFEESQTNEIILVYLNRLSDYFFVLGRYIAHLQGVVENKWIPEK